MIIQQNFHFFEMLDFADEAALSTVDDSNARSLVFSPMTCDDIKEDHYEGSTRMRI